MADITEKRYLDLVGLKTVVDNVKQLVKDSEYDDSALVARLDTADSSINKLETSVGTLEGYVGTPYVDEDNKGTGLLGKVKALQVEQDVQNTSINVALEIGTRLANHMDEMSDWVSGIEAEQKVQNDSIGELVGVTNEHTASITGLNSWKDTVDSSIGAINTLVNALETSVADIAQGLADHVVDYTNLCSDVSTVQEDLEDLTAFVGTASVEGGAAATGLVKRIETLEASTDAADIAQLRIEVDDHEDRIATLEAATTADDLAELAEEVHGTDGNGGLVKEISDIKDLLGVDGDSKHNTVFGAIDDITVEQGEQNGRLDTIEKILGHDADEENGVVAKGLVKDVRNLECRVEALEDATADLDNLEGRVSTLETTVGDSTSGLVKDVADNASEIVDLWNVVGSDLTGGLQKKVDDLETTVGDSTTGLVKDVADLKSNTGKTLTLGGATYNGSLDVTPTFSFTDGEGDDKGFKILNIGGTAVAKFDTKDFTKDGMLSNVEYVENGGDSKDEKGFLFTFNADAAKTDGIFVPFKCLFDANAASVKVTNVLGADSKLIKTAAGESVETVLTTIVNAVNDFYTGYTSKVEELEGKIKDNADEIASFVAITTDEINALFA